ncbi:unnamed protein product, partial [Pylaiella littoralis]
TNTINHQHNQTLSTPKTRLQPQQVKQLPQLRHEILHRGSCFHHPLGRYSCTGDDDRRAQQEQHRQAEHCCCRIRGSVALPERKPPQTRRAFHSTWPDPRLVQLRLRRLLRR